MDNVNNYMTIRGKRLEIEWHGPDPEEAPTLIFLHEGLGCVSMWRDFPSKLASVTNCGALVYSREGYGKSDPCRLPRQIKFMHNEGLEILPEIIQSAGIKECILVGHSDGGSIAIIYAGGTAATPLRGLVTEAAHVFCEEISVRSIQEAKVSFEQGDLKEKLEKFHGKNTNCAFWGWNDVWLDPDFRFWNIEEYLPNIKVPLLAIQGDKDKYGTFEQTNSIHRNAGGKTEILTLPDCGHSPHREKESMTLSAMSDFIIDILR
ncbi:alpha/beta fold hydrolase [Thermodesulfobacteriota bacterium]